MINPEIQQRLILAHEVADLAGEVIRRYFRRSHLPVQTKRSEISAIATLADQESEQEIVDEILVNFPGDGILREEGENKLSESGYSWVIDPIDGTSAFVRGLPIFGTLIALVDAQGLPLFGLADQPILWERWQGVTGSISLYQGQELTNAYAQETDWSLDDACLTSTTPLMFVSPQQQAIAAYLQNLCRRTAFGGDCYNYLSLACGWSAMPMLILEADMKYYDFCALIPIIQGSGGIISDWSGQPLSPTSKEVLAAANPSLHQAALQAIADHFSLRNNKDDYP